MHGLARHRAQKNTHAAKKVRGDIHYTFKEIAHVILIVSAVVACVASVGSSIEVHLHKTTTFLFVYRKIVPSHLL